ncbi:hypothetical protein MKW92_039958 [Papaver armeniacum]|nr:hypothetical protein MKW92_039958 [Papaver armeniacum]
MEALTELCDLIVQNPSQFTSKLSWICGRCPQPGGPHSNGSMKVTRSQFNAVLAISRFISKCPNEAELRLNHFFLSFCSRFHYRFSITSFYSDLLSYVVKACELCKDFGDEVGNFLECILISAINASGDETLISRVFLTCVSQYCPPILQEDAEKVVGYLLEQFVIVNLILLGDAFGFNDNPSPRNEISNVSGSSGSVNSRDQSGSNFVYNDAGQITLKQQVALFEESQLSLEKNVIALRLLGHIAEKIPMKTGDLDQVRFVAKKQLKLQSFSLSYLFTELQHGSKLNVFASLDPDIKSSKKLLLETLALFIDAAESCLYSIWKAENLVLLIRLKPLVLTTCAQADTGSNSQGAMFESVTKTGCEIIEFGWSKDRAPVETFIMGLAACIRERNDYEEQEGKEKQDVPVKQLNVIVFEVVDMILPLFIESLEEGDASAPSLLRLQILDAVSRMACLGFEKSYRETVTLPAGFLLIAGGIRVLSCDWTIVSLAVIMLRCRASCRVQKVEGAEQIFLGPLLPAVAEICSDFDPTADVEPSLLKLFRNLWFYIALFGLAPPIQKNQLPTKSISTTLNSVGSMSAMALQAVGGPYMFNAQWCVAVQLIAQGTPPLVVSSVKWLEDELELNALHNPGSRRGSGNEKAAVTQKELLFLLLWEAELSPDYPISHKSFAGVKATYLLRFAFLEIIRFSSNGGILNGGNSVTAARSAFSCVFEYLKTPNLMPAVFQCLSAIVHRALKQRSECLKLAMKLRAGGYLSAHTCFLIKSMSQREEHLRDISVSLLSQLKDRFPQVNVIYYVVLFPPNYFGKKFCGIRRVLDSLLFSVNNNLPSTLVNDPASVATVRSLYQKVVWEWITNSLSYAPCTSQGLLQEKICKANTENTQHNADVVSLLSEIRIGTGKNDGWMGIRNCQCSCRYGSCCCSFRRSELKLDWSSELWCSPPGKFYNSIGGFQNGSSPMGLGGWVPAFRVSRLMKCSLKSLWCNFNNLLTLREREAVDKSLFREACSRATALLLSNLGSDSRSNLEGFSQLLRLLCWCPAYISTPDAMETGIFIWTWLVSAAPQLGSLVLAELVDAWLWTIDTKRGLFAYEVVRHDSVEQLLLLGRMLQGTIKFPSQFSRHPVATGTFFTMMLLGFKFCSCQWQGNLQNFRSGLQLLEDRIYRRLGWFANEPEWFDMCDKNFAQSEAQSVSLFVHHLSNERVDALPSDSSSKGSVRENGSSHNDMLEEKRKQLLLMLCQHEADRLEVWATPVNTKENTSFRLKVSSEKWSEYARTAFSVDPRIAFSLVTRFRAVSPLKSELHIVEIRSIAEALPFFVTPKAVDENSVLLQQLPHWAACSITQALEFLTPAYKGHPRSYPPERVTFFMPQLVQALPRLVEGYLLRAAQRSDIFAHILIWHLQGETCSPEVVVKDPAVIEKHYCLLLGSILEGFNPKARDIFEREFDFFDKVTSISGALYPLPKEERAGIRRWIAGSHYSLQQSSIMITFDVIDRDGDPRDVKPQACIFKVGDDCRQDVLALQVISLLRDIFEAVGLNLYVFPYGVLPTGPERGIIEVVPNTRSRSQMGETTDGGLSRDFPTRLWDRWVSQFEAARDNFIISAAGYAVASLLLQPKDRHNGNLLFDNVGRLVHIDFGFIFEISPGGNMRFESAHFKLSHEMTQLLDPSGVMKSETWNRFLSLCVKGYLAARRHMDGIINTVLMMLDSGLPCFSRGDPIGNLRKRFHPEMTEREAANFMIRTCVDAYNKWTTAGYDLIQYLQQGIEK